MLTIKRLSCAQTTRATQPQHLAPRRRVKYSHCDVDYARPAGDAKPHTNNLKGEYYVCYRNSR